MNLHSQGRIPQYPMIILYVILNSDVWYCDVCYCLRVMTYVISKVWYYTDILNIECSQSRCTKLRKYYTGVLESFGCKDVLQTVKLNFTPWWKLLNLIIIKPFCKTLYENVIGIWWWYTNQSRVPITVSGPVVSVAWRHAPAWEHLARSVPHAPAPHRAAPRRSLR